jgi:hypothetical protein
MKSWDDPVSDEVQKAYLFFFAWSPMILLLLMALLTRWGPKNSRGPITNTPRGEYSCVRRVEQTNATPARVQGQSQGSCATFRAWRR